MSTRRPASDLLQHYVKRAKERRLVTDADIAFLRDPFTPARQGCGEQGCTMLAERFISEIEREAASHGYIEKRANGYRITEKGMDLLKRYVRRTNFSSNLPQEPNACDEVEKLSRAMATLWGPIEQELAESKAELFSQNLGVHEIVFLASVSALKQSS